MKTFPRLKIGIIIVLLVVFFVVLNLTGFSKEVKNFFYLISSPVQKTLWQAGDRASDFFETINEIKNLKKENEQHLLRNQELLAQIALLKELRKENEILREALEIGLEKEFKLTFAQIISKDISEDTILINKGLKDGLSEGQPVITQQKILLGKISQVYRNFSKVMLISHKESTFSAKVQDYNFSEQGEAEQKVDGEEILISSITEGMAKGRGGFRLFLDLIPRNMEIREGDKIVTTSLGGIFPKGLLVGQVKEVKKLDVQPFQQAEIKPAFDIKELENLFIIVEF